MRKTLIALILVLPMIFVLVIFSSVNLVSLGVNISVNGIKILAEGTDEDGTLLVDMADKTAHTIKAEVLPNNATEKGYTLLSDRPDVAEVTKEGRLVPKSEGTAKITAKSNDKSFTADMTVVVVSSTPYEFDFALYAGEENVLEETEGGYEATLPTGTYRFDMAIEPFGFTDYTVTAENGTYAEVSYGQKTIFLPFSGTAVFDVEVPGGVRGTLRKTVTINVTKADPASVIFNGEEVTEAGAGMQLAYGTRRVQLYVESRGGPQFRADAGKNARLVGSTPLKNGRYLLEIELKEGLRDGIVVSILADGKEYPFYFTFSEFELTIATDMPMETLENGAKKVTMLTGSAVTFYAVASAGAKDVDYTWTFDGPETYLTAEGGSASVRAVQGGEFHLTVTARHGDAELTEELILSVVSKISAIQIANNVKADLAADYTVAGKAYSNNLTITENTYPLRVFACSTAGTGPAGEDVTCTVSDEGVASVERRGGSFVLIPKGTGKVTVTAEWTGNAAFGTNVRASLTVNVVSDAVAVKNAPELVRAMAEKRPAVLTEDIRLGTDAAGNDLPLSDRIDLLRNQRTPSTYNVEWYRHTADRVTEESSKISYVLEFTADVYGNGKSVNAENYTHALDASGKPLLGEYYRGPLYFVKYKEVASVAGQDNCAFLVRTDGIRLYGLDLLGCSDESLLNESGEYDLTKLNLTGTTLEVNASCDIVNCRIRNGRNVVRAYGGNRDGSKYFIDSLSENNAGVDGERITVRIEGCILSQGREFLLKMGANRALRASLALGAEPALLDQSGKAYAETGKTNRYGALYDDPWFYSHYVMTDLTLKDSALETSGLFTVGIESNFSGEFLYAGASDHQWRAFTKEWEYSGGTSFASVLRLEGDVRLYDWKDLSLIDSSTLIESPVGALSEWLKLDIKGMLNFFTAKNHRGRGRQAVHPRRHCALRRRQELFRRRDEGAQCRSRRLPQYQCQYQHPAGRAGDDDEAGRTPAQGGGHARFQLLSLCEGQRK